VKSFAEPMKVIITYKKGEEKMSGAQISLLAEAV
jgi:hypothetical protein